VVSQENNNISEDFTVVIIGERNTGKTTFSNKLQEKSETTVPSTIMEYSYYRKNKKFTTNQSRDVVHCWELSGDSKSAGPMTDIVLNATNIGTCVVVLTIDLSRPQGVLEDLLAWFDIIRIRSEDAFKDLRVQGEVAKVEEVKKKSASWTANHRDR
jgi:hypothetical protein